MFTKNVKRNEFGTTAKLTLAFLTLVILILAASALAPYSAGASETRQDSEVDIATEAGASSVTLNMDDFQKLEVAGTSIKNTSSVAATAAPNEDLDFEVYAIQDTIYTGLITPFYIKTKNLELELSASFTDSNGNRDANNTWSISTDDVVYASNTIYNTGRKISDAKGWIFACIFSTPGRHSMHLRFANSQYSKSWTIAEFTLDVQDNAAAENAYIDSLIASQTNSSMDSFEKMTAISRYLSPKMKYLRCYTNPKTGESAGTCFLLEDYGIPWYKNFIGSSYTTPAILCRIAERVGGFTDIHNCYGDYAYGTSGWYSTHYLCKCTGINKEGKEQVLCYTICPSDETNLVNAKNASELTKIDFSSTYTSRWEKLRGGFKGPVFQRLAGNTAIGTMKQIVNEGWDKSEWAIVATTSGYYDALSASGLAGLLDCPILMTAPDKLTDATAKLISSKGVKNVIVVGGTSAVSANTFNQIKKLGVSVERVAGNTAIGTANKIYERGKKVKGGWGKDAIVATASGYQDALSIAPYAYAKKAPIFLAKGKPGTLVDTTAKAIKNGGFTRTIITGGTSAVAKSVESQVKTKMVERLAGNTAYGTCRQIAEFCLSEGMTATRTSVATGQGYQDALAGAALCGKNNSILVLIDAKNYSNVEKIIGKHKNDLQGCYIFGGENAVPWWVENFIASTVQ